jgi:hypothetical protein
LSLGSSWCTHAREFSIQKLSFHARQESFVVGGAIYQEESHLCVRKHKLLHVTKIESLLGIISFSCVQTTGLPSSGPSLHAVIFNFFQQNFIIIFYQIFLRKSWAFVFS